MTWMKIMLPMMIHVNQLSLIFPKLERKSKEKKMSTIKSPENVKIVLLLIVLFGAAIFKWFWFQMKRRHRRNYYRNNYLNSEAWQRKRMLVLKRDNWCCVYCGGRATQVHHKRYAKKGVIISFC